MSAGYGRRGRTVPLRTRRANAIAEHGRMRVIQHEQMAGRFSREPAERETVELIRDAYSQFNATRDVPFDVFHKDVVYEQPDLMIDSDTYVGHAGLRRALDDMLSSFESFEMRPSELLYDSGERIVVRVEVTARGQGSGAEVQGRFFHVWTMRGGKVARGRVFMQRAEALEAAIGESRSLAGA
jgi:ketosteroid isomerase-like protein